MYGGTHFQESESTSFNSVPYFHPSPRLATFAVSSVFPIISLSLLSFLPMCYYQHTINALNTSAIKIILNTVEINNAVILLKKMKN